MKAHKRRLFWFVYLHGLLMIVVMLVGVVLVGRGIAAVVPFSTYAEDFARNVSARGARVFDDADALQEQLKREHVAMTVRKVDGTLIASNVEPPLAALSPAEFERIRHAGKTITPEYPAPGKKPRIRFLLSLPLPDRQNPEGYITVAVPLAIPIAERLMVVFIGALGALALGSIPLARLIARPMEKLTATARALGQGDLSVRSGIRRKDEVGELASAFDEMAERLQRLLRGEKELLANVSHELRTPLARIGVALDLAGEADAEKVRDYLTEIRADVTELDHLVDDVLTAARLDTGAGGLPQLKRERVQPGELVERSAAKFREAHPERALGLHVSEALPALDVDPALVQRAIDNLLENARKYSDAAIELTARAADHTVTIEVLDQGIGIEPADLPRLFTPFFRTDKSRARGSGGVGLGLALTKRIVEAHGGKVSVDSAPGERTAFRLELPAA